MKRVTPALKIRVGKQAALVLAAVFLPLFLALPGIPAESKKPPPRLADDFSKAEYHFHSGDWVRAQVHYQSYLRSKPTRARAEKTLFRLGQIDQNQKSYATALRFYKLLLTRFPGTPLIHDLRLNMAKCHFELGQDAEAESLFREVEGSHPDRNMRWQALLYTGRLRERQFDYRNAIAQLKKVYDQGTDKKAKEHAYRLIREIIDEKLDKFKVLALAQEIRRGFPADLVLLRLLSIYRAEGDHAKFKTSGREFLRLFPDHPEKNRVEKIMQRVELDSSPTIRLGAVLPLTGKLALTGQQVLHGIQLAVNQQRRTTSQKLELVVRDSASGIPVTDLVEDLAGDPSMVGIIGPVLSENVKEAVAVAKKYQIPLFTPTASSPGLPELSPYVFRNALTREIEAKFLALYAVNELNLRRFAILYPLESYGFEMRDIFAAEVESLGAEVVARVGYDRGQTDFRGQILELGGIPDDQLESIAEKQAANEPVDENLTGDLSSPHIDIGLLNEDKMENLKVSLELNYDAIFIPGFYDKVGLILPQLVFYNIDEITLLGARGWNSPELIKIAGNYLKSGFFVDGFFPKSDRAKVRNFVAQFSATFGNDPTLYSAQAYDSANIFIQIIGQGADNRLKVREQLGTIRDFPGVSGKTTILPSGDSQKELFTLIVSRKKIVELTAGEKDG